MSTLANWIAGFAFMVPKDCRRLQSIVSIVICRHVATLRVRIHDRKHGGAEMLGQIGPSVHDEGEFGGKVAVRK